MSQALSLSLPQPQSSPWCQCVERWGGAHRRASPPVVQAQRTELTGSEPQPQDTPLAHRRPLPHLGPQGWIGRSQAGRSWGCGVRIEALPPPGGCRRRDGGRAPETPVDRSLCARAHMHRRVRARSHAGRSAHSHIPTCAPTHRASGSFTHHFFCVFIQQRLAERSLDVSTGDSTVAGQAAQIQRNRLAGPVGLGL